MRRLLLVLPLLLLAGCKKDVTQGAVKVTVKYGPFLPGCLRVEAFDVASGQTRGKDVVGTDVKGTRADGGSMMVALIPPLDWGASVGVRATAFEQSCEGKAVVSDSQRVTVELDTVHAVTLSLQATDADQDGYVGESSNGTDCRDDVLAINPGAEELCDDVDDNCDGVGDTVHFQLGEACSTSADCSGVFRCGTTDRARFCDTPPSRNVYLDGDQDGHGKKDSTPLIVCGATPDGYTTGAPDDCDDTNRDIRPGLTDLCDDVDTNCDGVKDEGFPTLTQQCTDSFQCTGTNQCNSVQTALECVTSSVATLWYPDEDGDTFGGNTGIVQSCVKPAGAYVTNSSDCNDGDSRTHPGATELCDDLDNDCDGQKELQSVCPGGNAPAWTSRNVGSGGMKDWYAASSWTRGGVWVGGDDNRRARLLPTGTNFTVITDDSCGADDTQWRAIWADPTTGRAWLGSEGGKKAHQDTTAAGCSDISDDNRWIFGMTGLRTNNVLTLYGANSPTGEDNETTGTSFTWDGGGTLSYNAANNALPSVYNIHGSAQSHLLLVGGASNTPRVFRFNPANSRWETENAEQNTSGARPLRAVWVVNDQVAFAVGDGGTVLRKVNGTQWVKQGFPNAHDLTSVIAFGAGSAYATCANGHIYRYNGQTWTEIHAASGGRLNDITGTGPDDLWVVGIGGRILRWPAWP
ncbi:sialidase [Myxococcus sp. CA033]|uniref:MopE-related protein n=1 Tax=Myxococcus sp. CA033 TaxID=2741516 RepID=UPI00157A92CC|nr:MopE-related protein [Myxococcus sp. CA033]NTX34406.1 sialidase [Myxococcus sp. CA033]